MIQEKAPKVLVFDSGFGGITILREIRKQNPHCQLVYCSDNGGFPYGTKEEESLISRVSAVLQDLYLQEQPDIIVVACNTASTVALPAIRNQIKTPIVGVVPAIKPASKISRTPNIGLLATPGTVDRSYTQDLIDQFGSDLNWVKVGSSELVQLAEHMMFGDEVPASEIATIVSPLSKFTPDSLDTIVLACTHFPLLKQELKEALPNIENWVDSTHAIADRVSFWLHELGFVFATEHRNSYEAKHAHKLVFTAEVPNEEKLMQFLVLEGFDDFEYLS